MKYFSQDDVVNALKEIVKGKEDFVYEKPEGEDNCLYTFNGEPSCLVGCALHKLGVSIEELERMDARANEHESTTIFDIVTSMDNLPFTVDYLTLEILDKVQARQDDKWSWGLALNYALADGE